MWNRYNPNPAGARVGDCAVRAVSKALDIPWDKAYTALALQGFMMSDMPSANSVWGAYLKSQGFERELVPNTCPDCYTIDDFCKDHPQGTFVVATNGHVATVINGNLYDSWDSSGEMPLYYYIKENE